MAMRRSEVAAVLATIAVVVVLAAGVRTVNERYFKKSVRLHKGTVPHVKPSAHSSSSPGDSASTNGGGALAFRPHGLIDSSGFWIVMPAPPAVATRRLAGTDPGNLDARGSQVDCKVGGKPCRGPKSWRPWRSRKSSRAQGHSFQLRG